MNAILESALVAVLIIGSLGALAVLAAIGDLITRRPVPPRPTGSSFDYLTPAKDFFHGNDRVRLSVALARNEGRANGPQATTRNRGSHGKQHQ